MPRTSGQRQAASPSSSDSRPASGATAGARYCPNCGAENGITSAFCQACGVMLPILPPRPAAAPASG